MESFHEQINRDLTAQHEKPRSQEGDYESEVAEAAESKGRSIVLNQTQGEAGAPSATGEALATESQPEEPDIEDYPEPSAAGETVAFASQPEKLKNEDDLELSAPAETLTTAPQPEGPNIEDDLKPSDSGGALETAPEPEEWKVQSSEEVLAELEATVQSKLSAITICWIEIAHILASVHANYGTEVFDQFVNNCHLKPNMATKLRAVGCDCWFNRPEVREQFKHAEKTELYYAHLLDDGQKEKLLAEAETGKPISRKLINEIRGEIAKPKKIFRVAWIEINLQSMREWKTLERTSFCQLIANLKLQCDTSAPFGVSFIEKVEDLLRKK